MEVTNHELMEALGNLLLAIRFHKKYDMPESQALLDGAVKKARPLVDALPDPGALPTGDSAREREKSSDDATNSEGLSPLPTPQEADK